MQLTQARIEEMRNTYVSVKCYEDWPLDRDENIELCNMALRLAAIENAGDEEVERLLRDIRKYCVADAALNDLELLLKSSNQVIADLRAQLAQANKNCDEWKDEVLEVAALHGGRAAGLESELAELRAKLGEADAEIRNLLNQIDHMKRTLYGDDAPNPSEIPNSSFDPLDEHTLSQADADALKKMLEDGTAKARFPLTGHGITEVPDAAKSG